MLDTSTRSVSFAIQCIQSLLSTFITLYWCPPDLLGSFAHDFAAHAIHGSISAHPCDVIPRVACCLVGQQVKVHLWLNIDSLQNQMTFQESQESEESQDSLHHLVMCNV